MSGKKTRRRREDEQPGEKVLYDTPLEELWESRGGITVVTHRGLAMVLV